MVKSFKVFHCRTASIPIYNTPGGAIQYFLIDHTNELSDSFESIQELLNNGKIEEIDKDSNFFIGYPEFGVDDIPNNGGNKNRKSKPTHRKKISKRRKNKSKRKTKKQK